jgi:NAD(P)-dependent dehydrogenase (short-subunit alcohol dehydrogenase family)
MTDKKVAVIAGAGEGVGKALAQRFMQGGFETVIAARDREKLDRIAKDLASEGTLHVVPADLTEPEAVKALFDAAAGHGAIGAVVCNAAMVHFQPILEVEPETFEQIWRIDCLAGFLVGQEAARRMVPNKKGSIIYTGATASVRGAASFVAFAAAKAGLRSVAQSMARSLGPEGIHVAHVVIDGVIDTPANWEKMPDHMNSLKDQRLMKPVSIAEACFALHQQEQSAWSFEIDLRPAAESF